MALLYFILTVQGISNSNSRRTYQMYINMTHAHSYANEPSNHSDTITENSRKSKKMCSGLPANYVYFWTRPMYIQHTQVNRFCAFMRRSLRIYLNCLNMKANKWRILATMMPKMWMMCNSSSVLEQLFWFSFLSHLQFLDSSFVNSSYTFGLCAIFNHIGMY